MRRLAVVAWPLCRQSRHQTTLTSSSAPRQRAADSDAVLPSWVLCSTVAEAHALASLALQAHSGASDLLQFLTSMRDAQRQLASAVHVPRDVTLIDDLPMFLAETLRHRQASTSPTSAAATPNRFTQMSEEDILQEFDEWVLSSLPPGERPQLMEPAATTHAASSVADVDTMPYLSLLSLIQSYMRYHRGVLWGASLPADGGSVAAFHRRAYLLHPWHGVACPEGWAQQMPYVHVLQWMTQSADAAEGLFPTHQATESFAPPSLPGGDGGGRRFTALDVCSQSGFGVDLLLKAGAVRVVAVDAAAPALGSTEATVNEHMKEKRSRLLGGAGARGTPHRREVEVRRCELLPEDGKAVATAGARAREAPPPASTPATATAATLFASAAARRRQLARGLGRAYEQELEQRRLQQEGRKGVSGPYDVLYYHPPAPAVWPLAALPACPPTRSVWWRIAEAELHRRAPAAQAERLPLLLPFLVSPTDSDSGRTSLARPHPHQSLATLERFVNRLRRDAEGGSGEDGAAQEGSAHGKGPALVQEGGYVVCVLPRSYDPLTEVARFAEAKYAEVHRRHHGGTGDCLSDFVVNQLDGLYDVVLRRRHFMSSNKDSTDASTATPAAALLHYMVSPQQPSTAPRAISVQASRFLATQWWVDVLVLRKRKQSGRVSSTLARGRHGDQGGRLRQPVVSLPAVEWEDSFEYNEYKPQSSPSTRYHWTDLVPTYSYLEQDFFPAKEGDSGGSPTGNFLAVGHPPELRRAPASSEAAATAAGSTEGLTQAAAAADRFKNVFAEELRGKRRSKIRKMAFAPIEQQEWYIDEKLIQSEAAKVDFMNELSRWDFQDYDT